MTQPGDNQQQKGLDVNFLDRILSSDGEMGALVRELDWSKTPIGPVEAWPQSLQTAVSICLFSRFPMLIFWGPEYIKIYNDAYRPILGASKHPRALGQSGKIIWAEIWHIIGPMLESVYAQGKPTWSDDEMLPMDRNGFVEETYFTFSYSPIMDESAGIGGVLTVTTETTKQVLGERRLKTLHDLSKESSESRTPGEACQLAANVLQDNAADIPFALFYLLNEQSEQAELAASVGVDAASDLYTPSIDLTDPAGTRWPLLTAMTTGQMVEVNLAAAAFTQVPQGSWPERPHTALVLPLIASTGQRIVGFVIIGLSARLALDDDYQHFCELVAGHVSTSISNARAYEAERKRTEALAELDRAKTEFFSNVSHEFRTPLTLMLNPLQDTLNDADSLDSRQRENLTIAYRNSLRLLKLVNTLLDFSRIQANRIQASFVPVDLATMTTDLASNFRSAIERAGLGLVVDCPPLPEPVYVDADMWEKIVLNLLSNALKFTFEGEISISLRALPASVELTVRDTGIGIDPSELPYIFDRFHRVPGARSRTHEGSGIGLALVAELVRFQSGEIDVQSEVNTGTTFHIRIPRGADHLSAEQIGGAVTLSSTAIGAGPYVEEALRWLSDEREAVDNNKRHGSVSALETTEDFPVIVVSTSNDHILLVEDNADMREYVRRLLESRYQFESVPDGIAALEAIQARRPDLIIADVMMPRLDGFGLLERIRTNPETRTLPVMLLSARAGDEARIEGLRAGADDYLVKPFSARELVARVDAQLKLSHLRTETAEKERASQHVLEGIVESIADPFYALDREWRFIFANSRAQEMMGKRREELLGYRIWDLFSDYVNSFPQKEMVRAMEQQQIVAFESFSEFLQRWVEVHYYPSDFGLAVYFRDITPRKLTEQRNQRLQELSVALSASLTSRQVIDMVLQSGCKAIGAAAGGVYLVADDQQTLEMVGMLGLPFDEDGPFARIPLDESLPINEAVRSGQLIWIDNADDILQRYPVLRSGIEAAGFEGVIVIPFQSSNLLRGGIYFLFNAPKPRNRDDQVLLTTIAQLCGQSLERARLYELETEARHAAEEANDLKMKFWSMISHELRTPLTSIKGFTSTLLVDDLVFTNEQQRHFLGIIEEETDKLTELVEQLLDLSRLQAGTLRIDAEPVSLPTIIDAAHVQLDTLAEHHDLHLEIPNELPLVMADVQRIAQVIVNLVGNAVKFSPPGTGILLSAVQHGSKVQINVSDEGVGIPTDERGQVFEAFHQIERKMPGQRLGAGLGLAICKGIVETHGENIWIQDVPVGTTISFTLSAVEP